MLLALVTVFAVSVVAGCTEEVSEGKVEFLVFNADGLGLPTTSPDISSVRMTAWDKSERRILTSNEFDVATAEHDLNDIPFGDDVQFFFEGLDNGGNTLASSGTRPIAVDEDSTFARLLAFMVPVETVVPVSAPIQGPNGLEIQVSDFEDGTSRAGHSTARLKDGRVLVIGGAEIPANADPVARTNLGRIFDTLLIYDPQIGYFEPLTVSGTPARLTAPRAFHSATELGDGRILVAGGVSPTGSGPTTLQSAEIIQLSSDNTVEFIPVEPMSVARAYHTATRRTDGTVLMAGGRAVEGESETYLATADLFDPVSNTFAATNTMSVARADHSATVLADGNSVLLSGGRNGDEVLGSTEFFTINDQNELVFRSATTLAQPRFGHGSATLGIFNGRYLVFAGGFVDQAGEFVPTSSVEIIDSSTGSLVPTSILQRGRGWIDIVSVSSNRMLVAGGLAEAGGGQLGAVSDLELLTFSPDSPEFEARTLSSAMRQARYHHDVLLLDSGMVLLSGGTDGASTHNDADLFNPGMPEAVRDAQ